MSKILEGGCLCGRLRYRITADPIDAGYCHCRLCQRASGAPVLAWLTVPLAGFEYVAGTPHIVWSSKNGQREYCHDCCSQLVFRHVDTGETIDVTIATLDDPHCISPQYHIWTRSRINWLHIGDDLPQFGDSGPDEY